jgi:hypothetical protein
VSFRGLFRRRERPASASRDLIEWLDARERADIAVRLLFTTEPTDRALAGWSWREPGEACCPAGDGERWRP